MEATLLSIATFFSTSLGGLFSIHHKDKLHRIMGFTAGVLLGVVFFDIFPEIIELIKENNFSPTGVMIALVLGFLIFHILEKTSWTSDEFVQYLKSWDEEVMEKDALETAEERGIKKEKVKMALRLLALKTMDANTIAQLTELAVEEIETLKNDNNI